MPRALPLVALVLALALPLASRAERDLDALARRSTAVVRGEIVGLGPEGADLHVLAAYQLKGTAGALIRVRSEGERALEPSLGDRGLYFLRPSGEVPGALAFAQDDGERWRVEPEADAAVDAFMRALLSEPADSPAKVWLQGLALPAPALAHQSARRLAALARQGALAAEDWDRLLGFLQGGAATDEAKAAVVAALGAALPADRALALLPQAPEGSRLKAALLGAMAARAATSGQGAQGKAREAITAAASDASPDVALAAAAGLAALGDERALPGLEAALRLGDPATRQRAVEALGQLAGRGSREARRRLRGLFDDDDGLVRARARQAWADAYFSDPVRQQRTRPSLVLAGVALALLLGALAHAWVEHRRG